MIITEHENLNEIIDKAKTDHLFVCGINRDLNIPISKSNGYKIISILLEDGDPYYEPEEFHGLRIYTALSNKFKDCKTIAIPFWEITNDKLLYEFNEWYKPSDPYNVYVNNGYVNILTYGQYMNGFEKSDDSFYLGKTGVILVSDGMYSKRTDALAKLISIISE